VCESWHFELHFKDDRHKYEQGATYSSPKISRRDGQSYEGADALSSTLPVKSHLLHVQFVKGNDGDDNENRRIFYQRLTL